MALDDISSESDVTQSSDTSVTESSESSEQRSEGDNQHEAGSNQSTEAAPFNDPRNPVHPRFQELIDSNRGYKEQISGIEQKMQQMQAQYEQRLSQMNNQFQPRQQEPKPHQELLEQLKAANPQFASLFEKTLQASEQLPALNQQLENMKIERERIQVNQKLGELYTQYKVPDRLKGQYERAIKTIAYENPKIGLSDADKVFKQVHEEISSFYKEYDREKLTGYVKDKKSDQTPSVKTGGVAPSSGKQPKIISREEYRAQARSAIAQALRDGNKKI